MTISHDHDPFLGLAADDGTSEQAMRQHRWYRTLTLFGVVCGGVGLLALAVAMLFIVVGAGVAFALDLLGVLA